MATKTRKSLHQTLVNLLGSSNVYFQPPESFKLKYPCIVYFRQGANQIYADNGNYITNMAYDVTLINRDPDDGLVEKFISELPMCRYDRHYVSDNLHHDVFVVTLA